jgi:hypothetical protein
MIQLNDKPQINHVESRGYLTPIQHCTHIPHFCCAGTL